MEQIAIDPTGATLRLSESEFVLLNNALNEVTRLLRIPESEFKHRLGETRSFAWQLLHDVNKVLTGQDPDPEEDPANPLRFMV